MTSVALNDRAPYKTVSRTASSWTRTAKKSPSRAPTTSRWTPTISSASTARISCGSGPAASITRTMCRSRRRCLPGSATPIAASATRCAFCSAICMISNPRGRGRLRRQAQRSIDRWILDRLQQVDRECRDAYAALRIPQGLPHPQPILRRRSQQPLHRYHQGPDVLRRARIPRAAARRQTAMHQIFDALCQLLAPILVFTADEAWGHLDGNGARFICNYFPKPQDESPRFRSFEAAGRGIAQAARRDRTGDRKGAPGKTDRQRARSGGRVRGDEGLLVAIPGRNWRNSLF